MSDRLRPFSQPGAPRPFQYDSMAPRQLTDYQMQLQPIMQQRAEEEERERSSVRPLQWIFDRLQTGRYVSANVANSLIEALQNKPEEERQTFIEAITTGITGEVRGSYEDVIRDTLGLGEKKIFGNAPEGTRRAQMDWADVLGFAADILLDPLTYVTFGGATKKATQVASTFADDSVRLYLRQLAQDPDTLMKLTRGRLNGSLVEGALAKGTKEAVEDLTKFGGDLGRVIDQTYRSAYQQGLRMTQSQMQGAIAGRFSDIGGPAKYLGERGGISDIARRLNNSADPGDLLTSKAYEGAGETFSARFMTRELGVGPERGITKIRRDTWDRFANFFKNSKIGSKVSDGIWGVMNKGPVGEIRRLLGFRNPYQKYLRAKELNAMHSAQVATTNAAQSVLQPLRELSEEQKTLLYKSAAAIEDYLQDVTTRGGWHSLGGDQAQDRLRKISETLGRDGKIDPETTSLIDRGLASTGDANVDDALDAIFGPDGVLRTWNRKEELWSSRLNEATERVREFYLPKIDRYRKSGANVRQPRKYTMNQSFEREVELTKLIYGVDDDLARELVESDATGLGVSIEEALIERAMIHGRAEGRYNLIEQIKELGLDITELPQLQTAGRTFDELGLETIDHPAFQGVDGKPRFAFDRDVAAIAHNAIEASGKGKNIFQKMMGGYMNWWKAMALLTTGYHARNFMTNTMVQFLHHGPRAFKKDEIMQSAAAVWYVLKKTDPNVDLSKFLGQVGLTEEGMGKILNQVKGNMTVRELAEEAWNRNVISQSTMGFDRRTILEQFQGKSKQPIRNASRTIGNYVENIPRFQSFMIDYTDNATADITKLTKETLRDIEKPALDFAATEAKKYFLDYEDLTSIEQNFLKQVIPFYTFLRKNLAAQISALTIYPEMYSLIPKVEEFITYDDPNYDPSMVPEWMRNEGMFPLRRADAELGIIGRGLQALGVDMSTTEGYRFFRPDFAYNDLNLIPLKWEQGDWLPHFDAEELKDTVINASAPWIRRTADFIMDSENAYNFFYQEDLGPTSDAPYLMRLFASNPEVVPFVDGLLKFAGFKNGAHIDVQDNKLQIDSRMALVLEESLPVLRQASYLFYLVDDLPWLNRIFEENWNVEDEYEGVAEVLQQLSFWLGIKMTDRDLEQEKQRLGRDIYFQAVEQLNEQRRERPGAEQRSLDYWNRTDDLIRRLR